MFIMPCSSGIQAPVNAYRLQVLQDDRGSCSTLHCQDAVHGVTPKSKAEGAGEPYAGCDEAGVEGK